MDNKRFKKFTKSLSQFSTHPMFNKLRKLYVEDDVKQLRTAENWLIKMKKLPKSIKSIKNTRKATRL